MMALTVMVMGLIYVALRMMLFGTPQEFTLGQMLVAVRSAWRSDCRARMVVEIFHWHSRDFDELRVQHHARPRRRTAPLVSTWLIQTLGIRSRRRTTSCCNGAIGLALMWPMRGNHTRALSE